MLMLGFLAGFLAGFTVRPLARWCLDHWPGRRATFTIDELVDREGDSDTIRFDGPETPARGTGDDR